MQDAYVGDIGDFGKLAMLRFIAEKTFLKVGVLWHFVIPNEAIKRIPNNDGKHRAYLHRSDPHSVRDANTTLHKVFIDRGFSDIGSHTVEDLEEICPEFTYFRECCHAPNREATFDRTSWLARAANKLHNCDLVFFDPDNGIGDDRTSIKHVQIGELKSFWSSGKSLVVYHHLPRRNHETAIRYWTEKLAMRLDVPLASIHSLRFRRGTGRVYFFLVQEKHRAALDPAIEACKKRLMPLLLPLSGWRRSKAI